MTSSSCLRSTSLRADGSRECAADDRLREAIQSRKARLDCFVATLLAMTADTLPRLSLQFSIVSGECFDPQGVLIGRLRCRIANPETGETHEQICDQAFDAGDAFVRGGRSARAGLCRA